MFIWNDYQESYDTKYTKFNVNRLYKNKSFKNEQEYVEAQQKLADEIAVLDRAVEKEIKKIVNESYPEIEILCFDSRMGSSAHLVMGRVLTRGIESGAKALEVEMSFEKKTAHKIHVDRIEDFDEETAKKILDEVTHI